MNRFRARRRLLSLEQKFAVPVKSPSVEHSGLGRFAIFRER